jgi:DNA-binding transcriptional LysR family regulator
MSLEDVEGFLIRKAMARYGNVSHAAKALGLSRSACIAVSNAIALPSRC